MPTHFLNNWMLAYWLLTCTSWYYSATIYAQDNRPEFQPGRLIIKIAPAWKSFCHIDRIDDLHLQKLFAQIGVKQVHQAFPPKKISNKHIAPDNGPIDLSQIYYLSYESSYSPPDAAQLLKQAAAIVYAEPEYIYYPLYTPNDPAIPDFFDRIQLKEAWDIDKGDTNVVIGIVDTGVNWEHWDLIGNCKFNYNDPINGIDDDNDGYVDNFHGWDLVGPDVRPGFIKPDNDPSPRLCGTFALTGHGSGVTGIAAAHTDNDTGMAGVGFRCKFLPIKTSGDSSTALVQAYQGLKYAADMGCKIINCSWGGTVRSDFGQDIVNYAVLNKRSVVLAAAGNAGADIKFYPASLDNVVSVGGLNNDDTYAGLTYSSAIDVSAPSGVLNTACNGNVEYSCCFSSWACPVAAGVAALIASRYPNYSPEQIAERLRVTSDDIYTVGSNAIYRDKLGKGRVNAYRALTERTPAIRMISYNLLDANNVPQAGDTMKFIVTLRNYLDASNALYASFTTADPFVTVINPNGGYGAYYGSIATLTNRDNSVSPIQIIISRDAPQDYRVQGRLRYVDGLYTDSEPFSFVINPSYANIGAGTATHSVKTTINSTGNFGYNDYPLNTQGIGFRLQMDNNTNNTVNYLYEGGLIIGRNKRQLVDNIRKATTDPFIFVKDSDFVAQANLFAQVPGQYADQEMKIQFNDNGATTTERIGINIKQQVYSFKSVPDNQYLIYRYTLYNPSKILLDSLYIGIYGDIDLGTDTTTLDSMEYDAQHKLLYAYGDETPGRDSHIGFMLLTDTHAVNAYVGSTTGIGGYRRFAYTDSAKFVALSSGLSNSKLYRTDVFGVLSAGPLFIEPNDSITVAFAVLAGRDLADIRAVAKQAEKKYHCTFEAKPLVVELGEPKTSCETAVLDGTTLGAAGYRWLPGGQTTPVITVANSGNYTLTVTDAYGCEYSDKVAVSLIKKPSMRFFISDSILDIGKNDTLFVSDSTPNVIRRVWNFGDGFGCDAANCMYQYRQPGIYQLTLEVENEYCKNVAVRIIQVINTSNRIKAANKPLVFKVYPNPAGSAIEILFDENTIMSSDIISLAIYNPAGQPVQQMEWSGRVATEQINLPNLPTGIYQIVLRAGDQIGSQSVFIQQN
jgi:hypothetical protein